MRVRYKCVQIPAKSFPHFSERPVCRGNLFETPVRLSVRPDLISNDEETSGSTCNWLPSIVSESHKLFTAFDQPGIF